MQRHKTVVGIILLIFSVVNFAFAVPVLERGTREVRVNVPVVDVAKDVATASQKRWKPLGNWWKKTALTDRMDTPQGRGTSGSDYRLEHELRPHGSRSPMDPNAPPQPSSDPENSLPLPVDPPLPVQNGHASPPSPVQNGHASPPSPLQNGHATPQSPLQNGHATPQSSQELIDGPILNSDSAGSPTHSGSHSSTDSGEMSPWTAYEEWVAGRSQSSSPSHDPSPPRQPDYWDLLNIFNHRNPPDPGLRQSVGAWSDPVWHWPYPSVPGHPQSDQGPPGRPHSPTGSEQSTGAYPPPDLPTAPSSNPEQSTGAHPPPDPSTPHSPSTGPLQDESERLLRELFRYHDRRAKRHISDLDR